MVINILQRMTVVKINLGNQDEARPSRGWGAAMSGERRCQVGGEATPSRGWGAAKSGVRRCQVRVRGCQVRGEARPSQGWGAAKSGVRRCQFRGEARSSQRWGAAKTGMSPGQEMDEALISTAEAWLRKGWGVPVAKLIIRRTDAPESRVRVATRHTFVDLFAEQEASRITVHGMNDS